MKMIEKLCRYPYYLLVSLHGLQINSNFLGFFRLVGYHLRLKGKIYVSRKTPAVYSEQTFYTSAVY